MDLNLYISIAITGIFTGAGVAIGTWFSQKQILDKLEKFVGKNKANGNKANLELLQKEIRRQIDFLDNNISCNTNCMTCMDNYKILTKEVNVLKELYRILMREINNDNREA